MQQLGEQQWPTWHNAARDASTREQVIRAVYHLFARRKPDMAGHFQQNKLPDFIRRLEESLYKMAPNLEEYADLNTLEQRLQQVVSHIVRKPGAAANRATSHSEGQGGAGGDGFMQQLMGTGGGGGDSLTPNSNSRQQAGQMALLSQQQQQQQMVAAMPNGNMAWMDPAMAVPQQHLHTQQQQQPPTAQQPATQQPQQVLPGGGGGNQLAVAGAPAGQSTAESAQRGGGQSGGMDYGLLGGVGGDVTSAATMPAGMARPTSRGPQQPGSGGAPDLTGLTAAQLNPTYMSNGAPVLLRGAGGGASGAGTGLIGGLVPAGNGMLPLNSSGVGAASLMPTNQPVMPVLGGGGSLMPQLNLDAGSMVPQIKLEANSMAPHVKLEGGGGMVPVGGGSAGGMISLTHQQQQQQPLALHQQQQQHQLGTANMMGGAYGGMMMPTSNGFGQGLMPLGGQGAGVHSQHPALMHQHQQQPPMLHHQQQHPNQQHFMAQLAHSGARQSAGTPPLPLMHHHQQQQSMAGAAPMSVSLAGGAEQKPLLVTGAGEDQAAALPAFSVEADQSFNLLGNAYADVDGPAAQQLPGVPPGIKGEARKQQILKQQRWLLFLRHCARCQLPEGQCQYGRNCTVAKQLWQHLVTCKDPNCEYSRCKPSRELLRHHQQCTAPDCPVCAPVKQYVGKQRQMVFHKKTASLTPELRQNLLLHLQQNPKDREMFQKRHGVDANTIFATLDTGSTGGSVTVGLTGSAMPSAAASAPAQVPQLPAIATALAATGSGLQGAAPASVLPMVSGGAAGAGMTYASQQQAGVAGASLAPAYTLEAVSAPKRQRLQSLAKPLGTSLLEYLSEEQIQTHVAKLQKKDGVQVRGLPKAPQPALQGAMVLQEAESSCKVCGLNRLTFEPPSLYCFGCGQRIKRNQVYYGTPTTHEIKGVWCHPCYQEIKTDTVPLEGFNLRKADLEKRKNDDEVEEGWVCCDLCEGWVHQICGLFNKGRNDDSKGFLCPFCLSDGLRSGERQVPSERPQAMLTARDLPTCDLSDHLQKRLERALAAERVQRAAMEGRHPSQVRTAEGLTVRVINNVVKRNDVRPRLHNAVQGQGYPEAFMYRQKVMLLFQNIDGVDLCLYCLYMQEYGDDVPPPNRKSVYLSYLDSVKYFQPEDVVAAGRGCALRTMVYHELLLGYLEYVKARGFNSMFIWACPPLAGDDYILYCHPGKQKTPRSDRLREWYHVMLNKAKDEGTVTYVSNMWDTYFEGGRDHRLDNLSVMQLPYYDGDYWPGEAENLLASITSETAGGGKGGKPLGNKGSTSSSRSKASLKTKARAGPASGTTTEELLRRLGDTIQGMREDFIVVHLQEPCSYCREYMSGGHRYFHPSPPQKVVVRSERTFDGINLEKPGSEASRTVTYTRFALCNKCYSKEIAGQGKGLPPGMQLQELLPAPNPLIPRTVDTVQEMENEFFDTRTAFLSLCQGNHYQFDSLRRAKHSSMMVLYHLHNPTAPAFTCTCNICNREIQGGEGFRCTTCPDFDMCSQCMMNPAVPRHEHPLVRTARDIDERRNRLSKEQLAARNKALHRTMQVLQHASECQDPLCPSTSCARVKAMYNHAMSCRTKLAGNCQYCRRMWMLLQMHTQQCTEPNCQVPRCTQLRNMRRQQAARAEDKRRAAYRTMVRQQTTA